MKNVVRSAHESSPVDDRELGRLAVVMPVFNEAKWVTEAIDAVRVALLRSPWRQWEIVVVDDGSTDGTAEVLDGLAESVAGLSVVHQANAGRFLARAAGLRASRSDYVFFLDSRVIIGADSLRFVGEHLQDHALVWNGHVDVVVRGNPFARFWDTLTRIAWSDYFDAPRLVSFGLEDFDRFPKGTGCFLAPRAVVEAAVQNFTSYFDDPREASDDTSLIRDIAREHRIWISPDFRCEYVARGTMKTFAQHAFRRGTFFVDGHLRRGARFAPVIVLFYPASLAAAGSVLVWWPLPALGLLGLSVAAGAFAARKRQGAAAVGSVMLLMPPFVVSYGLGIWRGLWLLVRASRT